MCCYCANMIRLYSSGIGDKEGCFGCDLLVGGGT